MTTPAQIQLMLVSEQAAPNLLPALDPAMKPREAVLLVSQKMAHRAQALQAVLQESGIKTQSVPLPDEHNMAALESILMDVATQRDGQSLALNVTGGNKLMALAAQAVDALSLLAQHELAAQLAQASGAPELLAWHRPGLNLIEDLGQVIGLHAHTDLHHAPLLPEGDQLTPWAIRHYERRAAHWQQRTAQLMYAFEQFLRSHWL